ncbi:hypothetical protein [Cryptosporangium minutisporangium]
MRARWRQVGRAAAQAGALLLVCVLYVVVVTRGRPSDWVDWSGP